MNNIPLSHNFKDYLPLFDSVISSLKFIFNIGTETEFMDVKDITKYHCQACKQFVRNPYKMKYCKHNFCYLCIIMRLESSGADQEFRKCIVPSCKSKKFDIYKWEKRNNTLVNEINALQVKTFIQNTQFIGTMEQFWKQIQIKCADINNNNILTKKQFDYFVNYMIKEVSIQKVSDLKQLKQNAMDKKLEGNTYFKQGKFDLALQYYTEALELCPNHYHSDRIIYFSNLALTHIKLGNYWNAYQSCLAGLAFNSSHAKLSHNLIKCYKNLNITQMLSNVMNNVETNKMSYYEDSPILRLEKSNLVKNAYDCVKVSSYQKFTRNYCMQMVTQEMNLKAGSDPTPSQMMKLQSKLKSLHEKDPTVKKMNNEVRNIIDNVLFHKFHATQFAKRYSEFVSEYEGTQRHVYRYLFDLLVQAAREQSIERNEVSLDLELVVSRVKENFGIEAPLRDIASDVQRQEYLVCGFFNVDSGWNEQMIRLPDDVAGIIKKFVFQKMCYKFDKFDKWSVKRLIRAKNAKLATKYKRGLREELKFETDVSISENNWKEIFFEENESCDDEFVKLV